jgi:hypothetical protein
LRLGLTSRPCKSCEREFTPEDGSIRTLCDDCRRPECTVCGKRKGPGTRPGPCLDCSLEDRGIVLPIGAPQPTRVPPGPAKVPILAARYEAGEQLFHPEDAR